MNKLLTKKVLAFSLVLIAPVAVWSAQEVMAGNAVTPLIDKDFEVALRKFASKRFYNRIDASAEQRQKLDELFAATQEKTRPMREEMRQGLLDLSQMSASDEVSDEQIKAKAQELRALHEKISDERLNTMLKVRKVLTAQQRKQIHDRVSQLITGGMRPRALGLLGPGVGRRLGMLTE